MKRTPAQRPVNVTLKDGGRARIRPARVQDADDLYGMERASVIDGRGEVRTLADLPPDLDAFRASHARHLQGDSFMAVLLVAELLSPTPRVVAALALQRLVPGRLRHVASLAITVHPEAQERGIGRALMVRAVDLARSGLGVPDMPIHRLELWVRADNHRALSLYESLGFVREGVRRDFCRRADGSFVDDIGMALVWPP